MKDALASAVDHVSNFMNWTQFVSDCPVFELCPAVLAMGETHKAKDGLADGGRFCLMIYQAGQKKNGLHILVYIRCAFQLVDGKIKVWPPAGFCCFFKHASISIEPKCD